MSRGGHVDAFVAKLSADGASLVYSTYLGGRFGDVYASGIAIDDAGHAYITGLTEDPEDFPVTAGAYQTSSDGLYDAFVAKLGVDGASLVYSTYLGGSDMTKATASLSTPPATPTLPATHDSADFPPRPAPTK